MSLNPSSASPIPAIPPGVKLTTLDNGLTLIVREDHSAPVVSAQAWCMAGSIHEGKWLGAGMSHVLEHMLFKGTTTRPGSRIDQEVQEAGGYMNAYTSFDRTVFHIDVPNTGAQGRPRHPVRHHAERDPAAGRDGQGEAGHPPRDGHERGRPGPPRQPAPVRNRLHQKPLSLHRHRLPGHLQRAERRGHPRRITGRSMRPTTSSSSSRAM